jgi:Ni/Co efflux regulator RcnB
MKLKLTTVLLLAFALAPAVFPQNDSAQSDSGVKQDTKEAANATGRAARKSGHKIKKGTKKVVHKGARGTREGAAKVEGKTKPSPTPTPQQD